MSDEKYVKTPGQVAFEAYNDARGGVTHDGKATPPWDALGDGVRSGWEAAASAVVASTAPFGIRSIYEAVRAARYALDGREENGLPISGISRGREIALVRTKLEEAEMWLERAMTKP